MEDAARLVGEGAPSGTVVVADYQRRGRGRLPQRRWESRRGNSLLFTLLLAESDMAGGAAALSLRAGLGLALYLEREWELAPRIKWPNDLLVEGRKIAGILCQGRGGRVLVGMGINLRADPAHAELPRPATSLAALGFDPPPAIDLLPELLRTLKEGFGIQAWREAVDARLQAAGRTVLVHPGVGGEGSYRAVLRGISAEGALILETSRGETRELFSGEIDYL